MEAQDKKNKFDGYVVNPLIGLCHWSAVSYCLANNIISEKGIIPKNYGEFSRKWHALKDLKEARAFANKVNNPPLEEMKKGIAKDFGPESPEEELISIDKLPF